MAPPLDPVDHRLLDEFQRDLPLRAQPFAVMAEVLGMTESAVISRLSRLQVQGFLTRVGATIRPNTAGASTLAAMAVPPERIDEVAAIIGGEPGVNHSYLRDDAWNLWFVATAPTVAELEASLARIAARSGLRVLDLRLVQPFTIDLGFRLSGKTATPAPRASTYTNILTEADRPLLQQLASGLPLVPRPYLALAQVLRRDEVEVIDRLRQLIAAGIIARLGVIVRHRALGWSANAMVVWDVPEARIALAGQAAAAQQGVTLCYERRPVPDVWPYRLYNMIHARSRDEALAVLDTVAALPEFAGAAHRVLFSTRCFKQTGALLHQAEVAA